MYFQVQTHVQTACESPDLNMDFPSFDNWFNSYTNRYLCKIIPSNALHDKIHELGNKNQQAEGSL